MKNSTLLFFFIFLFCSQFLLGQNELYRVKQTQMTKDFKEYIPLDDNLIFTKVIMKKNIIEIGMPENKVSIFKMDEVFKEYGDGNSYSYLIKISEKMEITLFFEPYPSKTNKPKLFIAFVTMSGLVKSDPKILSFFRLVFVEQLVIN